MDHPLYRTLATAARVPALDVNKLLSQYTNVASILWAYVDVIQGSCIIGHRDPEARDAGVSTGTAAARYAAQWRRPG